jgi:glucosyl-dolichyl phosphate glucuronosyltransferase
MGGTVPEISLVICTYNRCRYLPGALQTILAQTLSPERFELIIIDNNSTDDTAVISKNFIAAHPAIRCRYYFEANKGLSFARNRGIAEATATIVNFVDDDALLSPEYLAEMLVFFQTYPQAVGAGGKVIPKYEDGKEPAWMSKYLDGFIGKIDFGNSILPFSAAMKYPVGCNMAYKKAVLLQAGGFNNELRFRSDDKYIFYQVKKISGKVYFVPQAWLFHHIDTDRLEMGNFKKLFLKTGNEEKKRVRLEGGTVAVIKKFMEFAVKAAASVVLYILFIMKGQPSKGKYVFLSQWNTLKGFLSRDVYMR